PHAADRGGRSRRDRARPLLARPLARLGRQPQRPVVGRRRPRNSAGDLDRDARNTQPPANRVSAAAKRPKSGLTATAGAPRETALSRGASPRMSEALEEGGTRGKHGFPRD